MTIGELTAIMQTMEPSHDAFVALFTPDGTGEVFEIDAVQDPHGDAQLDIAVEEEVSDEEHGNGAERREDARACQTPPETSSRCLAGRLRTLGDCRGGERLDLERDGVSLL